MFTVINAMQLGPDSGVLTVPSVIKLSIVTVALIATGLLLAISIRAMLKVLFNGTEYGSWPGLKKWIGHKSTQSPTPMMDLLKKELDLLEEDMKKVSGVSPFLMEQMGTFEGLKFVTDPNVPKGQVFLMNSKHLIFGNAGQIVSNPVSNFFYEGTNMSQVGDVGICGIFKPDMDVICFADAGHAGKDGNHKWVSCALIANILQGTPDSEHLQKMRALKELVDLGLEVIEVLPQPIHPKLRKQKNRTDNQMIITEVLREYLEPIHMEGGETWLQVLDPQFTYDVLAERILQRLEGRE